GPAPWGLYTSMASVWPSGSVVDSSVRTTECDSHEPRMEVWPRIVTFWGSSFCRPRAKRTVLRPIQNRTGFNAMAITAAAKRKSTPRFKRLHRLRRGVGGFWGWFSLACIRLSCFAMYRCGLDSRKQLSEDGEAMLSRAMEAKLEVVEPDQEYSERRKFP